MTDVAAICAVDIIAPVTWRTQGFWKSRRGRTFGIVAAFAPTVFAIGVERISGYSRGLAVMIGPFWIGFATVRSALMKDKAL